MDFLARRTRTTTAEADSEGIVYVWEPVMASNIGAFVDTVTPGAVNDEGEAMGDVFSTGGCMTFPDGRPVFRPVRELAVAFEYYIKYATDYRIASRTRLAGFDAIHLDVGCDVEVALENPSPTAAARCGRRSAIASSSSTTPRATATASARSPRSTPARRYSRRPTRSPASRS